MQRRTFLRQATAGAITVSAGGLFVPLNAWGEGVAASSAAAPGASTASAASAPRLIVVLLRGAVDGLSVVAPYRDPRYAALRPTIALPPPKAVASAAAGDSPDALLDLDGRFGLHPVLAPLYPWWQQRQLAFVHASGSPDPTRSHFDAQEYMESGQPGSKRLSTGWLNRMMGELPQQNLLQALAVGQNIPRILRGTHPAAMLPSARYASQRMAIDTPAVGEAFDALYAGHGALATAYRDGVSARREIMDELQKEQLVANNGAPLPNGLVGDATTLARLMRIDPRVRSAVIEVGGWDTHVNQGAVTGQLANRLRPLGEGLATLAQGLGPVFGDTIIVVMSEFGRTVRENGNRGTDHGHGNVMWLMGGGLDRAAPDTGYAGGKVHGDWPGLEEGALFEKRDLAVTTDFRTVLTNIGRSHLRLSEATLKRVFPGG